MDLILREVTLEDVQVFYEFMQDEDQQIQAAFVAKDPSDLDYHNNHWNKIRSDETLKMLSIVVDGQLVGNVGAYPMEGILQLTYWVGKPFESKGYATKAVEVFLDNEGTRPLEARCAFDNLASIKVLNKNGFVESGKDLYFSNARGTEIEELIFRLT